MHGRQLAIVGLVGVDVHYKKYFLFQLFDDFRHLFRGYPQGQGVGFDASTLRIYTALNSAGEKAGLFGPLVSRFPGATPVD